MNDELTQSKISPNQKDKNLFGTIMIGGAALIFVIVGIMHVKAFYDLGMSNLEFGLPILLFSLVFFYGGYSLIKTYRKATSEAIPANAVLIHPYFRQGFIYGSLSGGIIVFNVSQLLKHKYDNEISFVLTIILSVYAAFSFYKLKKPSIP